MRSDEILIALDRTNVLITMMDNLLGSIYREDISEVIPAVKPHAHLLLRAQDALAELYQTLGNDLHDSEEGKSHES